MTAQRRSPRGWVRRAMLLSAAVTLLGTACAGPQLPEGATTFEVPSWDWDGNFQLDAAIGGTALVIDEDGCTFAEEGGGPVVFPNAIGVELADGTRAVVDEETYEVFVREGEEFSYAGGSGTDVDSWTSHCGDPGDQEIAVINDDPAGGSLP